MALLLGCLLPAVACSHEPNAKPTDELVRSARDYQGCRLAETESLSCVPDARRLVRLADAYTQDAVGARSSDSVRQKIGQLQHSVSLAQGYERLNGTFADYGLSKVADQLAALVTEIDAAT